MSAGRYRSVFVRVGFFGVALLCGGMWVLWAAGPSIQAARANPSAVSTHRATAVLFTAEIPDSAVIGQSVNLQRLNVADGSYSTVGRLYDDGTHGDATPGDGVFSLELRFSEHGPFPIVFRISAALRGSVSRVFSTQIVIKEAVARTATLKPPAQRPFHLLLFDGVRSETSPARMSLRRKSLLNESL